jgi:nucleoside phosphorylase
MTDQKEYREEAKKWLDEWENSNQLYGRLQLGSGFFLLSAITDTQEVVTERVLNKGLAKWIAVNENTRIRRIRIEVELEEKRTYWDRISNTGGHVYKQTIDKVLEPTLIKATKYKDLPFSENLSVISNGTETLQSKDDRTGKFTKSNFHVVKSKQNKNKGTTQKVNRGKDQDTNTYANKEIIRNAKRDIPLDVNRNANQNSNRIDVGIITIKDEELHAIQERFQTWEMYDGKNRTYLKTKVTAETGRTYNVAVVQCEGQGEGNGQQTTRDLIDDLKPRWIMLVGIGGAVPDNGITLGDVLLANRIHDFTLTALKPGERPTYQQQGGGMHRKVVNFLLSLNMREKELGAWNVAESVRCNRPEINVDPQKLEGDANWQKKVLDSLEYHKKSKRSLSIYKVAPLATSDALVRDPSVIQQWLESARHMLGVEMEGGGAYRAARMAAHEYQLIDIRGISDVIGYKRDDPWLLYACNSAAAFAYALLWSGMLR